MEIKDFKNKHKGQIGFIYGGGPSLRFIDIKPLKQYVSIAVNSGLVKAPFSSYALFDDKGMRWWSYYFYDLPKLDCINFLYKEKLRKKAGHLKKEKIVWFDHKQDMVLTKKEPIITARTSIASAVHLAYIMGINPIILLGVDSCYSRDQKRYFWQYLPQKEQPYRVTGEPVFSSPSQQKIKGRFVDRHCLDFVQYWNRFVEINKNIIGKKVNIFDCSDGILDCFPKITVKQIFKK